jgi:hypothetical protein
MGKSEAYTHRHTCSHRHAHSAISTQTRTQWYKHTHTHTHTHTHSKVRLLTSHSTVMCGPLGPTTHTWVSLPLSPPLSLIGGSMVQGKAMLCSCCASLIKKWTRRPPRAAPQTSISPPKALCPSSVYTCMHTHGCMHARTYIYTYTYTDANALLGPPCEYVGTRASVCM